MFCLWCEKDIDNKQIFQFLRSTVYLSEGFFSCLCSAREQRHQELKPEDQQATTTSRSCSSTRAEQPAWTWRKNPMRCCKAPKISTELRGTGKMGEGWVPKLCNSVGISLFRVPLQRHTADLLL